MIIGGIEFTFVSDWDGLPVKNKLPNELKTRLKTQNQWLDEGFMLKDSAVAYEMHPNMMSKKTCLYYLDEDVVASSEENCSTCSIRSGRFCPVAGDYIRMTGRCSEWM